VRILLRCGLVLALAVFAAWAQSPTIAAVVNWANMAAGPIAPGMMASLSGTKPAGLVFNGQAPLADPTLLHITIGGAPATVAWAGITMAGLYQINVQIPPLADGDQPIAASIAGVSAQYGLEISVRN